MNNLTMDQWEDVLNTLDALVHHSGSVAYSKLTLEEKLRWHKLQKELQDIRSAARRLIFEVEDVIKETYDRCAECGSVML